MLRYAQHDKKRARPQSAISPKKRRLYDILLRLDAAYDYSGWHWQANTPPQYVCISAVLVQHTNWRNVERALERLREADVLSLEAILSLPEEELAGLIRPPGTTPPKARSLQGVAPRPAG